jgi:uncharacterized protein with von Willebrand factor type A (vWA) domain
MRRLVAQLADQLRSAGVRISPAETIDAMRAVAATGFDRDLMREALATTLIKDEADRPEFDRIFSGLFRRAITNEAREPGSRTGVRGAAKKSPADGGGRPDQPPESARDKSAASQKPPALANESQSARPRHQSQREDRRNEPDDRKSRPGGDTHAESGSASGIDAAQRARMKALERLPFVQYSELDYESARAALAPLVRRFRVRAGRRLRAQRRGRVDFRRTIRAAIQHGGAMLELRMRSRRPRHVDLLVLADVSGSVRYAATLMLDLVAGLRQSFRRTSSFVFIDRLAEADFEDGHLVMTPPLDLYARSDFGRVLAELRERHRHLLGPATVVIVLGDARNNRRTARADILAEIARRCRAVCWLNPEPPDRWGRGDSAIEQYAHHLDVVIPATNLRELGHILLNLNRLRPAGHRIPNMTSRLA